MTVLEALVGASLLAMALMSQTSLLVANTKLSEQSRARSDTFVATREFMERLRAYDDWAGLYSQLRMKQDQASMPLSGGSQGYAEDSDEYALANSGPPTGSHATLTTHDGRYTYTPSTYLAGFESITDFSVLLEVPTNPTTGTGAPLLREDANLPLFKLPADLNGDGVIDGQEREGDYRYLPVRAVFVWKDGPTGSLQQIVLTTWLRGER